MNIIGFKYSIKNLLIFIQNTNWDPDLYEPNEDNKDKNNPLQVLKILYQGKEELFERDKKTYELTEKNISNEYINYIIDNLEVYSEFFYENIEKQTRIDDELEHLLYRGTQSIRNYFNFDVYRKKNKEIHVPVIKTNQPRSRFCSNDDDCIL